MTEISGEGKYAGRVGSICFNGVLNFTPASPESLTGSSKRTITLHTPAQGPIPLVTLPVSVSVSISPCTVSSRSA